MVMLVKNKLPQFTARMEAVFEDVLREVAADIMEESKVIAPYKDGMLRASTRTKSKGKLKREVSYGDATVRYAGAQEAGQTRGHKIRKYTTSGTGAHFLEKTGDKHSGIKIIAKYKKHAARIKV